MPDDHPSPAADRPEVIIYTDGACSGNPGPGGCGVVLTCPSRQMRSELSAGFQRTTNNRMEIFACLLGLRKLQSTAYKVTIVSDSRYVVDTMAKGWAKRWRRQGWFRDQKRQQPALNPDLWEEMLELCGKYSVSFRWVRGHATCPENNRCDALARAAIAAPGRQVDEGYERSR